MLVPALERLHYAPMLGADGKAPSGTTVAINVIMFLLTAFIAVAFPPVAPMLPRPGAAAEFDASSFEQAVQEEHESAHRGRSSHGSVEGRRSRATSRDSNRSRSGSRSGRRGHTTQTASASMAAPDELCTVRASGGDDGVHAACEVTWFDDELFNESDGKSTSSSIQEMAPARQTIFNFNFDLHAPVIHLAN